MKINETGLANASVRKSSIIQALSSNSNRRGRGRERERERDCLIYWLIYLFTP